MENTRDYVILYINGKQVKVQGEQVFQSLSDFLRYEKQFVGTKVVCSEGDCGSCTVVYGEPKKHLFDYKIVNSCIKYMYQLDGTHIITVEGLKYAGEMNPVQEAMVKHQGAQCGFCTPGFVVAMTSLFEEKKELSLCDLKDGLNGNLCRCTGYDPIVKAGMETEAHKIIKFNSLYSPERMLEHLHEELKTPVYVEFQNKKFFKPLDVNTAIKFKNDNEKTVIVSGGTDISVQMNKGMKNPDIFLYIGAIKELSEIKVENKTLVVGAKVNLVEMEKFAKDLVPDFYKVLKVFGSPQIRNAGTIAGNIANASPIADTVPFLFVMNAELELTGLNGVRKVNINDFYKGYKILDLNKDEMITKVLIPLPKADEKVKLYKISKRKDLDISTFTAAFLIAEKHDIITNIHIAFGGVGPTVMRLKKTEEFLKYKDFNEKNLKEAGELAKSEITPISDVRGSKDFRLKLAENIFMKLYFEYSEKELVACP